MENKEAALTRLLVHAFDDDSKGLRRWTRLRLGKSIHDELSNNTSLAQLAFELTMAIQRHGCTSQAFEGLRDERPGLHALIRDVAELWDIVLDETSRSVPAPSFSAPEGTQRENPDKSYRMALYVTGTGLLVIAVIFISAKFSIYPKAPGEKPVIAVLPFKNSSGDPDQDRIAEGIAASIGRQLLPFNQFAIIGEQTASDYKGRNVVPADLRRELGVHYVLQGSVQRSASTVRVTAELIDTWDNKLVWGDHYDRELTVASHFAIQDDITAKVVGAIGNPYGMSLDLEQVRRKRSITKLATYDCILMSFSYYRHIDPEEHRRARDCLEQAIQEEPKSFEVLTGLAWIYFDEARFGYNARPGSDPLQQALEVAQRAVEIARARPSRPNPTSKCRRGI